MKGNVKRYFAPEFNSVLYISSAARIRATYKALVRASKKGNTNLAPLYLDSPKLNECRLYALEIDYETMRFVIVGSDTALGMITGVRHEAYDD